MPQYEAEQQRALNEVPQHEVLQASEAVLDSPMIPSQPDEPIPQMNNALLETTEEEKSNEDNFEEKTDHMKGRFQSKNKDRRILSGN